MTSLRYWLWLALLSLEISAISGPLLFVPAGPALAVTASPPTAVCRRYLCQECLEYSGSDNRCLKCRRIPGCKIHRPSSSGGLSADAQAILNAHNGYRAKHCVPNLTWSAKLAADAQQWANGCRKNSNGNYSHSGASGVGENLYAWRPGGPHTAKAAADWFYNEIRFYDFNNPYASYIAGDKDRSKEVRHFTQVIWRNSTQVGCARAQCGNEDYWVCRYSPPGNWNANVAGELARNVPRTCR